MTGTARAGFTGTRWGMSAQQMHALVDLIAEYGVTELHHGDCGGADQQAHGIARAAGCRVVVHPPSATGLRAFCEGDEMREPLSYLERNHAIADETGLLIAMPRSAAEERRSGTWTTVRYARSLGAPVVIVAPDGTISREPR